MPDDLGLQTMVMDELAWEPSVDAAHIGVSASNGVVTLTGSSTAMQPGQRLNTRRAGSTG
jgi:osmotically-inducible protein OsmY